MAQIFLGIRRRAYTLYFAYGSNMFTPRLRLRVSSATPVAIGYVRRRCLRWDKRSTDGSGKCTIDTTLQSRATVWGVLFLLKTSEKPQLDQAEGLGKGYADQRVEVVTGTGVVIATTYVATVRSPDLRPYEWYKAFVVAGARLNKLPRRHLLQLKRCPSVTDPSKSRATSNGEILAERLFAGSGKREHQAPTLRGIVVRVRRPSARSVA